MSLYQKVRKPVLGMLRHFPGLRQFSRKHYYAYREKQYRKLTQNIKTDSKTVIFECFGGRQFGCSPRAIYEAMLKDSRFDDYELVWSFAPSKLELFSEEPLLKRAKLVIRCSDEYKKACAKAKAWIINTRIPEYIYPKDDQIYVQCWHGTPLKRLGYDVQIETANALNTTQELADRFGLDASKWSYLLSPSAYTSLHLADSFGLPQEKRANVVLEEGYPRNDRIVYTCEDPEKLAAHIANLRETLGIPEDKKMLLYAPTWRDDSYQAGKGYVMENTLLDFNALRKEIGDEWVVLFRAHYYIANQFDFEEHEGFVYDVSGMADINDLYIAADALLTDYSSVFFDYANTTRPIMFFWPDYQHYASAIRGFYFSLDELPGPHCMTTEEVAQAVKELDSYEEAYGADYASFRQTFCPKDDGHASERVIEKVFFN